MTISHTPKNTHSKNQPANAGQSIPQSRKRQLQVTASMPTTSKCARVEDSDEDEEPGHIGETLNSNEDHIMEQVARNSETELTDAEAEEDEDSEISEPTIISF